MNIQQASFFSLLKSTEPIKQKNHLILNNNGASKNEAINILGVKSIWINLYI